MSGIPNQIIDQDVYQGFWINRSLGSFHAATITLDRRWGGLMISFLALFINATARSFWKLIRFALHLSYTSPTGQDGVYHQRQAILRNTPMAYDAAIQFLQLGYVWRHRAHNLWARVCTALVITITIAGASIAAGIFSSGLLTTSLNEVLIAGKGCGTLSSGDMDMSPDEVLVEPEAMLHHTQLFADDFSYAMKCYGDHKPEGCSKFVQPTLTYSSNTNGSCPFSAELCKMAFGNLVLDSGDIESARHLGLNQGPPFTIRYQTSCAPLNTDEYAEWTSIRNSATGANQSFMIYNYGTRVVSETPYNYVHRIKLDESRSTIDQYLDSTQGEDYKISFVSSRQPAIKFIPGLARSNDQVSLIFLDSSEILYSAKTDDPWFNATVPLRFDDTDPTDERRAYASKLPGVLGCTTKRLMCNPTVPGIDGCLNMFANHDIILERLNALWPARQDQLFIYPLIVMQVLTVGDGTPETVYSRQGLPSLLSRNTLFKYIQSARLGSDRWQTEREHLFRGSLVGLQSIVVEYARGYWLGNSACTPEFPCQRLCYSQRFNSPAFYSFSAWSLFVVLFSGSILMLVAWFVEEIVEVIMAHTRLKQNKRLAHGFAEWLSGSTLQLQRVAHENLGLGEWKRTDELIPTTARGITLGVLDITDLKHARLIKAYPEMSALENERKATASTSRADYLRLSGNDHV